MMSIFRLSTCLLSTVAILLPMPAASLPDGYLDATFPGSGHFVFYAIPNDNVTGTYVSSITPLADDGVILGGGAECGLLCTSKWWIGKINGGGVFDAGFGYSLGLTNSCQLLGLCASTTDPYSIGLRTDDKLVVLYYGSLDRTTAQATASELVAPSFPFQINDHQGMFDRANAAVLQPDGKILLAGYGHYSAGNTAQRLAIVRVNATDMSVDTTFNAITDAFSVTFAGGAIIEVDPTDTQEFVHALFITPDGHIVLAGEGINPSAPTNRLEVARLNADGTVDATYGTNGSGSYTQAAGTFTLESINRSNVTMDRAGRVVAALTNGASTNSLLVARVAANGKMDQSFGASGFASVSLAATCQSIQATAVAIDSAGRIVTTGSCQFADVYFQPVTVRLRGDLGIQDTAYGSSGVGYLSFAGVSVEFPSALAFDNAGKLLVAGLHGGTPDQAGIARLTYDLIYTSNFESAPRGCLPPNCN